MLIPILVIVAAIAFIIYFVVTRQSRAGSGAAKKAVFPTPDDEEATQVRVAGPRIVRIVNNLKVGDEISIARGITVGKGDKCAIRLKDPELADAHVEFRVIDRVPVVADLGAAPTFVNDREVAPHSVSALNDGDRIRMGGTLFSFLK